MADSEQTGREVRITHVLDAPRELVFKAWTDPDQVAQWWSPEGFDIPLDSVQIEPRPGGRYDMTFVQAEGGAEFRNRAEIVEIVEPELLVLKNEPIAEAGLMEETLTRVELHDEGGKTRMVITDGPYDDQMRANAEAGRREAIGKLERLLAG